MSNVSVCPRCNATTVVTPLTIHCTNEECFFLVETDSEYNESHEVVKRRALALLEALGKMPTIEDYWEFVVNVDFKIDTEFISYMYLIAEKLPGENFLKRKTKQLEELIIPN